MSIKILNRYSEPSKLDTADYLVLCNVNGEYYIQLSQDSENPKWESIGKLNSSDILIKIIELIGPNKF